MRRLSLLLFLIVLACTTSLATAGKPYALADLATIPDSATTVITKEFTWRDKAGTTVRGWLVPSIGPLCTSVPMPGVTESQAQPGELKARIRVPILSTQPLPWRLRRCPAYKYYHSAWAMVGLRFRVASDRKVRSFRCTGRVRGLAHGLPFSLSALRYFGYDSRADYSVGFVIWSCEELSAWGMVEDGRELFPEFRDDAVGLTRFTGRLSGRAPMSEKHVDTELAGHFDNWGSPLPALTHGTWYTVALALNLEVTPGPYGTLSDTDLDFYSGDYGAYFDSLEIELEPVKQPSRS